MKIRTNISELERKRLSDIDRIVNRVL